MKKTIVRRAPKTFWGKKKNGSIMLSNDWIGLNVVVMLRREYSALIVRVNRQARALRKVKRTIQPFKNFCRSRKEK